MLIPANWTCCRFCRGGWWFQSLIGIYVDSGAKCAGVRRADNCRRKVSIPDRDLCWFRQEENKRREQGILFQSLIGIYVDSGAIWVTISPSTNPFQSLIGIYVDSGAIQKFRRAIYPKFQSLIGIYVDSGWKPEGRYTLRCSFNPW